LGSPLPTYTYGLNLSMEWNNFDLSLFLQGVGGNKIFKAYAYWTQGMTRVFNGETILTDRWTPTNTNTEVPRAVSGDPNRNARASDRFIDDGDYLRIKTFTIGYTVPLSENSALKNLRIYASAQNLLTITEYEGYDPEVSVFQGANFNNAFGIDLGQLPQARTFILGLQIGIQ
ncbi:MAG: TonB-dependent receptor, partial [Bacteroidota bacterium]